MLKIYVKNIEEIERGGVILALDKQISLFKVDTKAFLSDKEKKY